VPIIVIALHCIAKTKTKTKTSIKNIRPVPKVSASHLCPFPTTDTYLSHRCTPVLSRLMEKLVIRLFLYHTFSILLLTSLPSLPYYWFNYSRIDLHSPHRYPPLYCKPICRSCSWTSPRHSILSGTVPF